ncbi:MAG: hypothetical protein CMK46_04220 [Porticoccus sp.]|uniref:hypothetical protein n=1 Tax=Porticoccus hydrocarbonoclasticus TaxID=1073414 RepID=UPI000C50D2EF|nr:hypothetical protein [Porticoccus hydrocarbonoclasticus]MBG57477.1 hypothetical protein [Porticoccus sp.]|tara:strand:- start:2681 stop:3307 length:627 start_codon:yes stop_codon:yes gene_type:complete
MGGHGSGRLWHYGAKDTVEDYRSLDIRRLKKAKVLFDGNYFNWMWSRNGKEISSISMSVHGSRIDLNYKARINGGDWEPIEYPVHINWTECAKDGQRPWFICPGRGCYRRVAILYGGNYFVCRHCHKLAYSSQREADYDRLARRADRIRVKLGWPPGILNGRGWEKPKGMHHKTFNRLLAEYDRLEQASLRGIAQKLHLLGESIDDWI